MIFASVKRLGEERDLDQQEAHEEGSVCNHVVGYVFFVLC